MATNEHDHDHEEFADFMPTPFGMKENKHDNRIWVGEITDASAKAFVEKVVEITERDETAPILVLIDSDGGSIPALMTMIGYMDSVPNAFVTVALGRAISAGAVLLAHGDGRFASPHARIMIHESSWGTHGHIDDGRTNMAEWEVINNYLMTMLGNDMGMTQTQLKALFTDKTRDLYMSAEEALKNGMIDHVGIPSVKTVPPVLTTTYEISLLQNAKKPSLLRQTKKPKKTKKKS